METYIGIDIGTTNCKVAVFDRYWRLLKLFSSATPVKTDEQGYRVYDAKLLWDYLKRFIGEAVKEYEPKSIGITGMAEPGALVNRNSGQIMSDILPWNDVRSLRYSETASADGGDERRFYMSGLHNSYKHSVYKLLCELEMRGLSAKDHIWLQSAPLIAFLLTGNAGIDPTLALRTYAYNIDTSAYDTHALDCFSLPLELFPPLYKSGEPFGTLKHELRQEFGIHAGIPVAVCGHDHMCAAAYACDPDYNELFLSLGTTAVLLSHFNKRPLTRSDYDSGYSYGLHTVEGKMIRLGSVQSAGSAIEWCRDILFPNEEGYQGFDAILAQDKHKAGDIFFFPYLSGSGAPHVNANAEGAFVGLNLNHGRPDIARAVLEGIAYELRMIVESAPSPEKSGTVRVVGGGIKSGILMQTLADVLGREIAVPECEQAALAGAAMLASGKCIKAIRSEYPSSFAAKERYFPDSARAAQYNSRYLQGYLPMQKLLRRHTANLWT